MKSFVRTAALSLITVFVMTAPAQAAFIRWDFSAVITVSSGPGFVPGTTIGDTFGGSVVLNTDATFVSDAGIQGRYAGDGSYFRVAGNIIPIQDILVTYNSPYSLPRLQIQSLTNAFMTGFRLEFADGYFADGSLQSAFAALNDLPSTVSTPAGFRDMTTGGGTTVGYLVSLAVPTPGAALLLGVGLLGLAARRQRLI